MKILVLGGTGNISSAVVREFRQQGHAVWSMHRTSKPLGVGETEILCDRHDVDKAGSLLAGMQFDVVVDMLCYTALDAETLNAMVGKRTGHLVVASTVALYKRPFNEFPVKEARENYWTAAGNNYALEKANMERALGEIASRSGVPPITILRPSINFSPGCKNIGILRQNRNVAQRIIDKKPLVMFGDGQNAWQFTFSADMARAFAGVSANSRAFGKTFHYANPEVRAFEDLYLEIGRAVGVEPKIVYLPSTHLYGLLPDLCHHIVTEKQFPGVYDNTAIEEAVPGLRAEWPLARGIPPIVKWWKDSNFPIDHAKDAIEDRLAVLAAVPAPMSRPAA